MSLKDIVVNEIVKGVKTTEPLYKISYLMPDLSFDGDDIRSAGVSEIKCVIYNKSTYFHNFREQYEDVYDPREKLEEKWFNLLDPKIKHHDFEDLDIITKDDEKLRFLYFYKLSVELIN